MKLLFITLVTLVLFSANSFAAEPINKQTPSADSAQLRDASYTGTWSGTIKCLHDPGLWPDDECDVGFIFNIEGNFLSVQQVTRSKKGVETKSKINTGKFRFVSLLTNAIAISLESGDDEDGTWVETWSFAMTLTDQNHMMVHWTRIVNNIDLSKDKKGSKFSVVGIGELVRKP